MSKIATLVTLLLVIWKLPRVYRRENSYGDEKERISSEKNKIEREKEK